LRFKIKEAYINYIFSTIPYKHSDNILMWHTLWFLKYIHRFRKLCM
jgi:hypothetical protein